MGLEMPVEEGWAPWLLELAWMVLESSMQAAKLQSPISAKEVDNFIRVLSMQFALNLSFLPGVERVFFV